MRAAAQVLLSAAAVLGARQKTVKLRNGVEMPLVSVGVFKSNRSRTYEAVSTALSLGFTGIDTAYAYNNQEDVGRAVKEAIANGKKRSDIFVTTKLPGCGTPALPTPQGKVPTPSDKNCHADTVNITQFNLKALGLDYVDLMLLHMPPDMPGTCKPGDSVSQLIQAQWSALEAMYKAGQARAIGVSNYCQSYFECFLSNATVIPHVDQLQYHVGEGNDPNGIVSYLSSKDIALMAYSPLAHPGGSVFPPLVPNSALVTGNLTSSIGAKYGKSGAQVALRWITQKGYPLAVGGSTPKYLAEDIETLGFDLTDGDMATLSAAECKKDLGFVEDAECQPSYWCKA